MSLSYDLATVVNAVKADEGLILDLAGSGPDEPSLRQRAEGCSRIRFHGYLGEAGMRELLAGADVGVVPMFDESCVGVPYKLADYAAAGLPVASSLHGETAELLARHNAGVTYRAGDAAAFSDSSLVTFPSISVPQSPLRSGLIWVRLTMHSALTPMYSITTL